MMNFTERTNEKFEIAPWMFDNKQFELQEYHGYGILRNVFEACDIIKETEKAVQVYMVWERIDDEKLVKVWVPKSAVWDEKRVKEFIAEQEEKEKRHNRNYQNYYECKQKLQAWAKETLGTRANASEETILKAAEKAGVEVDENLLSSFAKELLNK